LASCHPLSSGRIDARIARKKIIMLVSVNFLLLLIAWKRTALHGQKKITRILTVDAVQTVMMEKEKERTLNGDHPLQLK
jgi:hypothetical protein